MSGRERGAGAVPVGATWRGHAVTDFRVWAPAHEQVRVIVNPGAGPAERAIALARDAAGYFAASIDNTKPGTRYQFELGNSDRRLADPASRFQPEGPHGPSEVVDPWAYVWRDDGWPGIRLEGQILYEMHVGTLTPAGTWRAAQAELPRLAALGITTLEVMPIAEFAGDRGWGYDGVDLFAPMHVYGTPDDLRRFVDEAHRLGLGVILDVVYNHVGPDGNVLADFSPHYFTTRYTNEWGAALNFDDEHAGPVRELITSNAGYWVDEFHVDGLRVDATQQMFDASTVHVLAAITDRARTAAAGRSIVLIAESESQENALLVPTSRGGYGFDAVWNDDYHHAVVVALTGRREAYYTDYTGSPQELLSLVKWGYLYQGQRYSWQKARRGTPVLGVAAPRFVTYLENHDQVANMPGGTGDRLHRQSSPSLYRALTAYWLLSPGTPMFFQGQEYGAREPFLFFAGHGGELGEAVRMGRAAFMSQFRSAATRALADVLPNPIDRSTFERCRLSDGGDREGSQLALLHRDLLRLRREDPVFGCPTPGLIDGAAIGERAFVLRWFLFDPRERDGDTRLLVVNLGVEHRFDPAPEPLLAPPSQNRWAVAWSSERPDYGGAGTAALDTDDNWYLPGHAAVVLEPLAYDSSRASD